MIATQLSIRFKTQLIFVMLDFSHHERMSITATPLWWKWASQMQTLVLVECD